MLLKISLFMHHYMHNLLNQAKFHILKCKHQTILWLPSGSKILFIYFFVSLINYRIAVFLQFFCYFFCSFKESSKKDEVDISEFTSFLEVVKSDYQNSGQGLWIALDKFKDRYNTAKLKSIPRLSSFLYDLNCDLDPTVCVKSGANIRVQVESIKRRKTESGSSKRRMPTFNNKGKENLDPMIIPSCKKRKTCKKEHNLSKNILNNRQNWSIITSIYSENL